MRAVKPLALSESQRKSFRRRLLTWFSARRRDLPWRRTSDPYCIWISEIMLQQTRVAAVVPYYERFVARYPNVGALADSPIEDVLSHWSGLGYYSRARNLQRAAKRIVAQHEGHFPREYAAALALPGIGRYTAAAVLSIAYDQPLAVLDGNVARVLARLTLLRQDPRAPAQWRKLSAIAQALLQRNSPGDWNQAMMELGATVCTPKSPRCGECPVARFCRAHKAGVAEKIPVKRSKRPTVDVRLAAAVLLDARGRTLLVRNGSAHSGLFSNLWQFPAVEIVSDAAQDLAAYLRAEFGVSEQAILTPLKTVRHAVTYRHVRIEPHLVQLTEIEGFDGARWPNLSRLGLPVSNATRKIAQAALAHRHSSPPSPTM